MRLSKEFIDARKQAITRGSVILADCAISTTFAKSTPASELAAIAQRVARFKLKLEEVAAVVRRLRA
jgi:hypothetical protein